MPITLHGEQGTPEWFQTRCGLVTASNFDKVMAKGRTKGSPSTVRKNYIVQLAVEALTGKPEKPRKPTWDMEEGTAREPLAVMEFEIATGLMTDQVSFVQHDTMRCGCSPDGLIGEDGGLEVKSPNKATHLSYLGLKSALPPAEYWWQLYGSMLVTGRSHWWFCSFHPEFPEPIHLHYFKVQRDEAEIEKLRLGIEEFNKEVDMEVQAMNDMIDMRLAA